MLHVEHFACDSGVIVCLSIFPRLAKHRLSMFPESYDTLLPLVEEQPRKIKMTEKERYALYLSVGQQQCLRTLLTDVGGAHEL